MTRECDAVVIGGGVSGLTAAAYLARAGLQVIVAEARNAPGGACQSISFADGFRAPLTQTLYALDPRVAKELKLDLKFAVRDMALVGMRADGKHIVLGREGAARSIAVRSKADAKAWPHFRRELYALARQMRSIWWEEGALSVTREKLEPFRRLSAVAFLDGWFESDALKATLAFDASETGLSPFEPGSALVLLWRASQEMCGVQGAVAALAGGPGTLARALAAAAKAAGADIRTGARVDRIAVDGGGVSGVQLASGETISARIVISGGGQTPDEILPAGAIGFAARDRAAPQTGTAKVALALRDIPKFGGVAVPPNGRFILVDRMESYAAAHSAARAGRLPDELAIEATIPTFADPSLAPAGQHIVSALVRPVPFAMTHGMKAQLAAKTITALKRHAHDMQAVASEVQTPEEISTNCGAMDERMNAAQMLANWNERLRTPVPGLILCGEGAISGRAGRIAAAMAIRDNRT